MVPCGGVLNAGRPSETLGINRDSSGTLEIPRPELYRVEFETWKLLSPEHLILSLCMPTIGDPLMLLQGVHVYLGGCLSREHFFRPRFCKAATA